MQISSLLKPEKTSPNLAARTRNTSIFLVLLYTNDTK